MINPITKLSDLLSKLVIEHGSAVIQEKHIMLFRDELAILKEKFAVLATENENLKAENQNLKIENDNLRDKVEQIVKWGETEKKYELSQLSTGVFVYSLKESYHSTEPPHAICSNCYSNRKKSILQPFYIPMVGNFLVCHKCTMKIQMPLTKQSR